MKSLQHLILEKLIVNNSYKKTILDTHPKDLDFSKDDQGLVINAPDIIKELKAMHDKLKNDDYIEQREIRDYLNIYLKLLNINDLVNISQKFGIKWTNNRGNCLSAYEIRENIRYYITIKQRH